jgi:hypothetical protein
MRLRLAAFALAAAACGLAVPALADDATPAAKTAELTKYAPEGSGYYVHVNVQQFLAAPVVRKAIPMAVDKYGDKIMDLVQLAKAFDPNAAAIPNEQVKTMIDELKKPETIAKAFDAAKDGLTDMVVAGIPGSDEKTVIIFKCHEAVNGQILKQIVPAIQAMPQIPVQIKVHEKEGATVYEVQAPQQPQAMYITVPKAGVVCMGASKELIEQAAKGGKGGLTSEVTKLVAERTNKDFVFFAMSGKGADASGPQSGWGRLVLDKNISGDMSATFANADKATEHAKEINEKLQQFTETIKGFLGPQAKDVAPVLEKMKAVASGSTVNAKGTVPGEVVEKLLAKDKE